MVIQSVTGLPVINDEEILVGSLSSSDLKGSKEENLFTDLNLSVADFLASRIGEFKRDDISLLVSCTMDDTIQDIVQRMVSRHIHRIFIVDNNNKLIGVLSLCDIIQILSNSRLP